jgi:23S rRNA (uracil1939-C5)-methyltransferase
MARRSPATVETAVRATIQSLAAGGDGVAIAEVGGERRAMFVRGVVPGDEVELAVDLGSRPARGRVVRLVVPGPDRATPACNFVDRCGGCDWMHLSPDGQSKGHAELVRGVLPPSWRAHPMTAHGAHEALGYRNRARLHVRASGGRAIVGMHEARTRDAVEVDACIVLHPVLEVARKRLAPVLEGAHGMGEATLALGAPGGPPVLELRWSGTLAAPCFGRIERAIVDGAWAGARVFSGDVSRPAVIGDPTPWMMGADGKPLRLPPGSFGQASQSANRELGERLDRLVEGLTRRDGRPLRIVELYAGAGNLTVLVAPRSPHVTTIEWSREACDAARANLAARSLTARVVEGDAARHAWASSTDAVILDPPRTGAREVAERLAKGPVRHVLYVSCDPPTLGRDLAILESAYAPKAIETVEMFPQTSHVETLVLLERRGRS